MGVLSVNAVTPINGKEPDAPITLADAQLALKDAAIATDMSINGAAMSAYINGLLQSARVTAIAKYLIEAHPEIEARLSQLTLDAILTDIIPKLQAQKAPTIITGRGH
jgi:hypothetical protein